MPIMADQDVANDLDASPTLTTDSNGHADASRTQAGALLHTEFSPRLASTRSRFLQIAGALRQAAETLEVDGSLPPYQLLKSIGDCHREFLRLRRDLTARAAILSLPISATESLSGISDLANLVNASSASATPPRMSNPPTDLHPIAEETTAPTFEPDVTITTPIEPSPEFESRAEPVESTTEAIETSSPAEITESAPKATENDVTPAPSLEVAEIEHPAESVRRSAFNVLDTVARLHVRDHSDFPPLNDCRTLARSLRDRIAESAPYDLPEETSALAEGRHPFCDLLTIVSGTGSLSDADWAKVHARVSETFGRPLAVAAARSRLRIAAAD